MSEYVWLVLGDNGGAWEPDPVLSIWTTEEAAKAEASRRFSEPGAYQPRCVKMVELNKSGCEAINDGR